MNVKVIEGSTLDKYDFLDYLKGKYPPLYKKYLMIKIEAMHLTQSALDSVFANMINVAGFAGYQYIMINL